MGQINQALCWLVSVPIFLYQKMISPMMQPCCRFYPSCSDYALMALQQRGFFRGLKLTFLRLLRCHPWSDGGYDPVDPPKP